MVLIIDYIQPGLVLIYSDTSVQYIECLFIHVPVIVPVGVRLALKLYNTNTVFIVDWVLVCIVTTTILLEIFYHIVLLIN